MEYYVSNVNMTWVCSVEDKCFLEPIQKDNAKINI